MRQAKLRFDAYRVRVRDDCLKFPRDAVLHYTAEIGLPNRRALQVGGDGYRNQMSPKRTSSEVDVCSGSARRAAVDIALTTRDLAEFTQTDDRIDMSRPELSCRDRNLVTVARLITSSSFEQLTNGLSCECPGKRAACGSQ